MTLGKYDNIINEITKLKKDNKFYDDFITYWGQIHNSRMRAYRYKGTNMTQAVLGLTSEVGELSDILEKEIRAKANLSDINWGTTDIKSELGDILYYLIALTSANGFGLRDLAKDNYTKLVHRGMLEDKGLFNDT